MKSLAVQTTYDATVDAAYISIKHNEPVSKTITVRTPESVKGEINLDFDKNHQLVGIELLYCTNLIGEASNPIGPGTTN